MGYKRTEVGVIPEDWNAVLLGDLFVFKNGLNKAKRFFGTGTPIVNYMDVFECPGLRADGLSGRVNLSAEEIKNFEVRLGGGVSAKLCKRDYCSMGTLSS